VHVASRGITHLNCMHSDTVTKIALLYEPNGYSDTGRLVERWPYRAGEGS